MATKDNYLSVKDKQKVFVDTADNQYKNLNLNQNHQCSVIDNACSKSFSADTKKSQNNDFSHLNESRSKKNANSWNKSNKHLSTTVLNLNHNSGEKNEFKKATNVNSSTLSLHIAAYENSFEATNESKGGEKEEVGLVKKWSNHFVVGSTSIIQNPFEFPRQQDDRANRPELMRFAASQSLLNPNQPPLGLSNIKDNRIVFFPSEAVSFRSLTLKQSVQLSITNNWDRAIIFKMKTTRPQLFKMRPVFGMIEKGQEKTIRLIFKGFGPTEKPPCTRDRFTIVVAPAPANCVDPSRVWKQNKCPEVLTQTARKVLRIEYGEVDNSKLVSVRPNYGVKTPEQMAILRKKFPDLREDLLQKFPLSACEPEPEPAAAKENKSPKPQLPDGNNNKNMAKKEGKNETEDSSSTSSD